MSKVESLLSILESTFKWDGKYLHLGGTSVTSIPAYPGCVVFDSPKDGSIKLFKRGNEFVIDIDNDSEATFKTMQDFVTWANRQNLKYAGIDDMAD